MGGFVILFVVILIVVFLIWLGLIPIQIAKARGITGSELVTISILSWAGFFVGITWIIALVLALTYQPQKWVDKEKGESNLDLDALEKLARLKKEGVLTADEYNREKKKLMGK